MMKNLKSTDLPTNTNSQHAFRIDIRNLITNIIISSK